MANDTLTEAKKNKNDEFYTQYSDIQKEISAYLDFNPKVFKGKTILLPCDDPEWSNFTKFFAQNFKRFGLKKLISTSFAVESKNYKHNYQPTLFESSDKKYDSKKTKFKGKIFTLSKDITGDGIINIDDLDWNYLKGDGDFRSEEVIKLRDESDLVITNPPFSLLREFILWINEAKKDFILIANNSGVGTKDIFSLLKDNKIWFGNGFNAGNAYFSLPQDPERAYATGVYDDDTGLVKFRNACWLTNLEHGRRHQPLELMTMKDNLKYNKRLKGKNAYEKYQNYDAIEVPFTNAIPKDYKKVMGVPISFFEKYCPDQFEILGMCENLDLYNLKTKRYLSSDCKDAYFKKFNKKGIYDLNASGVLLKNGLLEKVYQRVLIRRKK
jgi:hypothetical protein